MRRQAEQEKAEDKSAHFRGINIDDLTEEDRLMWQLVMDDWKKAQDRVREYSDLARTSGSESRRDFSSYLGNLIMRKMAEEMTTKGEM